MTSARSRRTLLAVAVVTIALGLATRRFPQAFPALIAEYGGDVLWAMLAYWVLALLVPRASPVRLTAGAMAISVCDELSQLIDWEWLRGVRSTWLGGLVFGQGFLWSDLACYAVGVALAFVIDWKAWGHDGRARR